MNNEASWALGASKHRLIVVRADDFHWYRHSPFVLSLIWFIYSHCVFQKYPLARPNIRFIQVDKPFNRLLIRGRKKMVSSKIYYSYSIWNSLVYDYRRSGSWADFVFPNLINFVIGEKKNDTVIIYSSMNGNKTESRWLRICNLNNSFKTRK